MLACGLKLTHDGAVALLSDDELVFSVEVEKLHNNPRYSAVADLDLIPELLGQFGYRISDVDDWVIDGWDGEHAGKVSSACGGQPLMLTLAPYRESARFPDLLTSAHVGVFPLADGRDHRYVSYPHVAGHLASAYCTSEFAHRGEPSIVLIWDGGLFPRLYWVEPGRCVVNGGEVFPLIGHAYATAAHHFGPFRRVDEATTVDDLSVAGKLMAYIALGRPSELVVDVLREFFHRHFEADTPEVARYRQEVGGFGSPVEPSLRYVHAYFRDVRRTLEPHGISDEDVLASVHRFLGDLLVSRVTDKILRWKGPGPWNLCFVGGCALNIKWNKDLRNHPMFSNVWVPPFPNDSGSAIGCAALGMTASRGLGPISWHVRLGPDLAPPVVAEGWTANPCSPQQLARMLHETGEPVVVLDGRAELGPRALGSRSILAPAVDPGMKDHLNDVKGRAHYRPVAPICLIEHAPAIFDPGTPDPYMVFDHLIRHEWAGRIPAVRHLDGTARLQTVDPAEHPVLDAVLHEYHRLSGIPVLCNTSANISGSGFFPDVASAMSWGRVRMIWSANTLYQRHPVPEQDCSAAVVPQVAQTSGVLA